MKKQEPGIVFDEVMATGWCRIQYYGDETIASRLIPEGRLQLGMMRTLFRINERLARGESGIFYQLVRTLPDGSEIITISHEGQDTIRIFASGTEPDQPQPRAFDLHADDVVICGTGTDGDANNHALLWTSIDDVTDLGFLPGGLEAEAYDIADDGSTVVGMARDSDSHRNAFRWTQADGMQSLGFLPDAVFPEMHATGVSADGAIVVGRGYDANGMQAWIWIKDWGFKVLPAPLATGVPTTARIVISPSGEYVAGLVNVPSENNRNQMGALWHIDYSQMETTGPIVTGPQLMDPGTTSSLASNSAAGSTQYADFCIPANVTDAGVVSGLTSHRTNTYGSYANYTAGQLMESGPIAFEEPHLTQTVFKWDQAVGVARIIGDGTACAAADDADTYTGWNKTSRMITNSQTILANESGVILEETVISSQYVADYQEGWIIAPDPHNPGTYVQVSLGHGTNAFDITEDGEAVVGCTLSDADGTPDQPMVWSSSGQSYALPLPSGVGYGKATAVAKFSAVDLTVDVPA